MTEHYAFFATRRIYPSDIQRIVVIPPTEDSHPGLLFIAFGCEFFDIDRTSVVDFKKKYPKSCFTFYTDSECMERFISRIESHGRLVDGKHLLNADWA